MSSRTNGIAVVLLAAAALVLTACGQDTASPGGSGTGSPPSVTTTGPLTTATESPSTVPEHDPGFISGPRTLTGTVQQGAEPGCWILQSQEGQFELIDPDPVPREGDHVTVVGHEVKAMSHCMQGRPFRVETLTIK